MSLCCYINHAGEELPLGHYSECELPQHGWLHVTDRSHEIYFRSENPGQRVEFTRKGFWEAGIWPDETLVHGTEKSDKFGLWSLPDNRCILPMVYEYLVAYLPATGTYAVQSADRHLQLRDRENTLLADFGVMRIAAVNILPGAHPLLAVRRESEGFDCIDLQTGERCGMPLFHFGPLSEGLRFVHDTNDEIYFVNEQWERVLELPGPRPDVWKVGAGAIYKELAFVDGHIAFDTKDGSAFLMNRAGQMVIEPGRNREIYCLGEQRLYLQNKHKLGALADMGGNALTSFCYKNEFLDVERFREQSLCLYKKTKQGDRCGCINPQGEEFIPFIHREFIDGFVDGLAVMAL